MMLYNAKIVLIVDDDPDIRDVMSMILDMEGFVVHTVSNGTDVPNSVATYFPDLILLDVMLGDADGRDICKKLKGDPLTEHVPIIIISATHGRETMNEKNCGADDYIGKPFDVQVLLDYVNKYVSN
ncbi:response regulator transcription factor [Mucilaginibacter ginkgonis]|uniref:Response regulator transcription factor n=1 Tax=Mucilaginibacter ginkgonis TaxID=2682091 RepID=A0A6I4IMX1_9SPHI|nr:response regulator transcription factor [Mucilaginibacter ginkgonis]QQL49951.1 response regulator transcription factor [Mucilaginibacter ginkgonis]